MTLKDFLNDGDRIATFTGQAYTGRNPLSVDALQ